MKDPTGIFGIEISDNLVQGLRSLSKSELDEFLQRCKNNQYSKLDGAQTDQDRLEVQIRVKFVEEFRNFFKTLLTKPQ